jgi:hypothetical protein
MAMELTFALHARRKEIQTDPLGIQTTLETLLGEKASSDDWKKSSLQFLCSSILATPFLAHKNALLEILENVDSGVKLVSLFPLVEQVVASTSKDGSDLLLVQLVKVFCMPAAKTNLETGKTYFKMFLKLLQDDELGLILLFLL